jgi:hypothetical protein
MGPGVLVAEGCAVQTGVQHPPRAGVRAADLGGQADDRPGAIAERSDGQAVLPHPAREQVYDGVVGVDTSPAGEWSERHPR